MNTEAELHALLVETLGGRAAEEIVFDTVTTGAQNDIEKATKTARAMVTQYGMSKKFGLIGLETIQDQYLEGRTVMNCSDETAAAVDEEVMKILKDAYKEAKSLLKENRVLLDKLAKFLIQKETITGKEFMEIYRAEKGLDEKDTDGKGRERIKLKETKSKAAKTKDTAGSKKEPEEVPEPEKQETSEQTPAPTFETEVNDETRSSTDPVPYDGMGAVVRGRVNNGGSGNEQ